LSPSSVTRAMSDANRIGAPSNSPPASPTVQALIFSRTFKSGGDVEDWTLGGATAACAPVVWAPAAASQPPTAYAANRNAISKREALVMDSSGAD